MRVLSVRNVAEALPAGLAYLAAEGRWEESRAGRVIVAPCPITTVYERPRERVLFSALRDANPFFHLAEATWMLAGRRDAAFLNNFVRDFGARFAEPNGIIHDAYGYRWRHALGFDQLDAVVRQLSENSTSRQAVVQIWDAYPDTRYITNGGEANCGGDDLCGMWRTRPCNTHAYLRIREEGVMRHNIGGLISGIPVDIPAHVLDLTVLCRSNDIWWGAYGANTVHFSILQEYLAARLDVGVGTLYQVSNNFHMYQAQLDQLEERKKKMDIRYLLDDRYTTTDLQPQPLVHDTESFDEEVRLLLEAYEQVQAGGDVEEPDAMLGNFHNDCLSTTVWPMLMAHYCWRQKNYQKALAWCDEIEAHDWKSASREWIARRTR